jgi:titin
VNNTVYLYNITAVNAEGEGPAALTLGTPLAKPTEPQNLAAEAGAGYVLLTWDVPLNNGSSDITAYQIYRNGSNTTYATIFGDEFEFNDTLVDNGVNYTYHVVAVNAQGDSPNSTSVEARPESSPEIPGSFIVNPGNGFINISWETPFDGGSSITEVFLYKNGTAGPYMVLSPDQTWFNDTDVTNGVEYTYYVSANNSHGEGDTTEERTVKAGAFPAPPVIDSSDFDDSIITITWLVPVDDGGMPITHYNIYKSVNSENWERIETGLTDLSYTDLTVTNGISYYYYVTAVSFVGQSKPSNIVAETPVGLPRVPTDLTGVAGDSYIVLTWKAPVFDGGSDISNYNIYRGTSPTEMNLLTSLNALSHNDTTADNDIK